MHTDKNTHSLKGIVIKIYSLIILTLCFFSSNGQVVITPNQTAAQLVSQLVGSGVTVSNATLNCPGAANGTFGVTSSNLGLRNGIILTCGTASGVANAASFMATASYNPTSTGDADLSALINNTTTRDACRLEFDFVPTGDTVKFRYVFGSEEYPGYACTGFNDVFGFFISGPGYTTPKNIALIPNTTIPVAINSTSGVVGTFGGNISVCQGMGTGSPFTQYYVNNTTGTTVAYNGFTTIFTAIASVIPCNTYHLKLAVADALDWSVDSGVFLEAGSLTSNTISVSLQKNIQAPVPYCVRGCKDGTFVFKRQKTATFPLTIKYLIGGTAVNGTDYTLIPDSVVIPANDTQAIRTIVPLTTASGTKEVKLYIYSPYSCTTPPLVIDTSIITIFDSLYAQITTPDTSVCPGIASQIKVVGDTALRYSWSPSLGLFNHLVQEPFALPNSATQYTMTATLPNSTCLPITDQITIGNFTPPVISTEPVNQAVCLGGNTTFTTASSGSNLTYQWQVSTGALFSNVSNSSVYSGATTNALTVTPPNTSMNGYVYRCIVSGTCTPRDTSAQVLLTVNTVPAITAHPTDSTTCENALASFSVAATGSALTYQWQVNAGSGYANLSNGGGYSGVTSNKLLVTAAVAMNSNQYRCVVSGACTPSLTSNPALLTVRALPDVTTNPLKNTVCPNGNATYTIAASGTGISYQWQEDAGTGYVNLTNNSMYSGATTNTLQITGTPVSMDNYRYRCVVSGACTPADTSAFALLTVGTSPVITTPPSSTPVCDGGNVLFNIGASGLNLTYQWQVNTGSGFTNITNNAVYSGATTNALILTGASAAMSGYQYQCLISGDCPPAITSGALTLVLTVHTLPSITSQPVASRICEGDNTSFTAGGAGTGISYQWQVDQGTGFSNVSNTGVYSGATAPTLNITGATQSMSGYIYRCVVPGTCLPDAITNAVALTVDSLPVINTHPSDSTVCAGNPVSFEIEATGTDLIYQWQYNNGTGYVNVPNTGVYSGAATSKLNISSATAPMHGLAYRCIITGICTPADTSDAAILDIDTLPLITQQPVNSVICAGDNANFTLTAAGTGISYQWQLNTGSGFADITDNSLYSGANTNSLAITAADGTMTGYQYRCLIPGTCAPPETSNVVTLTVNRLPIITSQPNNNILCAGSQATLGITATGTNLTYTWQVNNGTGFTNVVNGGAYTGATSNTLIVNPVAGSMSGNKYRCVVTGVCLPSDTSDEVQLTIYTPPNVTTEPTDTTICQGDNAAFKLVATGTSIFYRWQVNTGSGYSNLLNNGTYAGVSTNSLSITNGTAAMNGYTYRCIINGICAPSDTSEPRTLTVNIRPIINSQPHDSTICDGGNASFGVTAAGTALTYQWQADAGSGFADITNSGVYSGTTGATLFITNGTASMDGTQYRCIVSGTCTPIVTSGTATLTVQTLPTVHTPPQDSTICEGGDAAFTVSASGTGIIYKWQVNTGSGFSDVVDNATYSGASTATVSITNGAAAMNGYTYRCVVSGICTPVVTSAPATLTVNTLPLITMEPGDSTICEGGDAAFSLAAVGTAATYRWQENNGSGFTDISNNVVYSGATTSILYLTTPPAAMSGYTYRCIVAGACMPEDTTNVATITIHTLPSITLQPQDKTVCDGQVTSYTVAATGTSITYQWQVDTGSGFVDASDDTKYNGTTTSTLDVTDTDLSMNGNRYRCVVTGICTPPAISAEALLTIDTLPYIITQPADSTVCANNNVSFSVAAGGTTISYQWQEDAGSGFANVANNAMYSGATSHTLHITTAPVSMDGFRYRCLINGVCSPVAISDTAALHISTPPAIVVPPSSTPICDGGNVVFSLGASGTNLTYQWQVNTGSGFTNISNNAVYSGATTNALTLTGASAAMSGYQYQCLISGDCPPSITSGALTVVLTVFTLPSITTHPVASRICEGDNTSFTAAGTGTGITYQWQVNQGTGFSDISNTGVYSGATAPTLNITGATQSMSGYLYRCMVPGTCLPDAITNAVALTVDTIPVVTMHPTDSTVCDGNAASFAIEAVGTNLVYQWQYNNGTGYINVPNSGIYSGTATSKLSISAATATMHGFAYRCIVTGACTPTDTSDAGVLDIDTLPLVTQQPINSVICEGDNTTFTLAAIGTDISYQWQVNTGSGFADITNNSLYGGATTNSLAITAADVSMTGYEYRCIITGICSPVATTNTVTLTINTLPVITSHPTGSIICDGSNTTFAVSATGTALTYQWQVSTGSGFTNLPNAGVYSGVTTNTLYITAGNTAMNSYQYRCIVFGTCTPPDTSNFATITVYSLPSISDQPDAMTVCDGNSASFAIVASGTGITYQWQLNTGSGFANIPNAGIYSGATTNTLSLSGTLAGMNGYQYRCVVTGTCTPPAVSTPATLTVNTLPAINGQPANITICDGSNASFSVSAIGTGLTYQWQADNGTGFANLSNTGVYSGTTAATLQITGGAYAMHGYDYRCIVSGTCTPAVTSGSAELSIYTLPLVTANPVNSTICEGGNTSFSITATGTGITYQWQVDNGTGFVNISNSSIYSGVATPTVSITAGIASMHGYQYRCVVNGTCLPAATSTAATLTVNTLPLVTVQPEDSTICEGNDVSFTITATGTAITYQWQENNGSGFTDITNSSVYSGATTNDLHIAGLPATMSGFTYRCVVSGTCTPPNISLPAQLTVNTSPVVIMHPQNRVICETDATTYQVNATGAQLTYQWQVNDGTAYADISNNTMYSGATTAMLSITGSIAGMNGWTFRCIVNGKCTPPDTSNAGTLTVYTAPVVTVHPGNVAICPEENTLFNIVATGTTLAYQWQVNTGTGFTDLGNNAMYNGVNNNTLSVTAATAAMNNYQYRCVVSGACMPNDTSNNAVLTIHPKASPAITSETPMTFCFGGSVMLNCNPSAGLTYQWQKDGANINGATQASYLAKVQGDYKVTVFNTFCYSTADSVEVVVNPLPVSNIGIMGNSVVCPDTGVILLGNEAPNVIYQWYRNNASVGTDNMIHIANDSGMYELVVTNEYGCSSRSDARYIEADPGPKPVITSSFTTLCTEDYKHYQWFYLEDTIRRATTACITAKYNGTYTVFVTNEKGCTAMSPEYEMKEVGVEKVIVSPNPATSTIYIHTVLDIDVQLTTLDGKILFTGSKIKEVDIRHLANGTYLLNVFYQHGDLILSERVLKVSQ